MNNWKVIPTVVCATVLIFGAGVFTGGMLVDAVKQSHPKLVKRTPSAQPNSAPMTSASASSNISTQLVPPIKPPEILSKDFLQKLDHDLQLNKEQHEAVSKIINDGQNLMRKVVQDGRLEIREVLSPAQRQQFDDLMKRPFHKPLFNTNAPPGVVAPACTNPPPPAPASTVHTNTP